MKSLTWIRSTTGFFVALGAITLNTNLASALLITTGDGNGGDSYVRRGSFADTVHGHDTFLIAKNNGFGLVNFDRKIYLKFDLSSVPSESAISQGTLLLVHNGFTEAPQAYDYQVYGLRDGVLGEDWDESTLTWNNATGNDKNSPTALTTDALFLASFRVPADAGSGSSSIFSITSPQLADFLNDDTNGIVTLIVTRPTQSSGLSGFHSKESPVLSPPTLDLELAPVPEPASSIVLGLGAMLIICRRHG